MYALRKARATSNAVWDTQDSYRVFSLISPITRCAIRMVRYDVYCARTALAHTIIAR